MSSPLLRPPLRLRPWHCALPAALFLLLVDHLVLPSDVGVGADAGATEQAAALVVRNPEPRPLHLRSLPAGQRAAARSAPQPAPQLAASEQMGDTRIELRLADVDARTLRRFLRETQSEVVQVALVEGAVRDYRVLDAEGNVRQTSSTLAWERCREARSPKRRIWVQLDSRLPALREFVPPRAGFGDYLVIGATCSQRLWRQAAHGPQRPGRRYEIFLRGHDRGRYRVSLARLEDGPLRAEGRR